MKVDYNESLKYVHAIPKFVRPLGNEKLGGLLALLGNPHEKLKFIHVAGTNGKGSVCAMTAEVLKTAGYKTGLFTSPFIEVFNERIRINGEIIADDVLAEYITKTAEIMEKSDMRVSEFAFITAVAMKYFYDNECDIVVLETGMGGRLDATNIIPVSVCAALTSISLDHTQFLGDTLDKIAAEKCGIIKSGSKVVSAPNKAVSDIIKSAADDAIFCDDAKYINGSVLYKGKTYEVGLTGLYQAENVSVVIEIISAIRQCGFNIDDVQLRKGLKNTRWQARYEFITPDIVIDGGHNADGVRALKESLLAENRPITLLMAMMADKDYEECIKEIAPIAKEVIATEVKMERSLKADEIKAVCQKEGVLCISIRDVKDAIEYAIKKSDGGLLCICGSLYLAGSARSILRELLSET